MFTLHGVTMVWLFMIPAIPSAFGNFVLPLMLGAKDVAFPRLNLASVYIYVAGSALTLFGMLRSGADTGWTFYTPYSTHLAHGGDTHPAGGLRHRVLHHHHGAELHHHGAHAAGAGDAPGCRIPLFVWALYGTSVIQVVATPVLGMVLLLVFFERVLGVGLFDPSRGEIRCSSSTCSGSTRTRRSTSWCCRRWG